MKKLFLALTIVSLCLSSCRGQASTNMKSLDGVEYPAIFVDSGYYFDKATRSDANLTFLMSNVKQVEKPSNLGSVDLPDFSKITLYNNPKEEITAATIEAEIEAERDKYVSYTPIKSKRAAALGDRITMDFKCYAPNSTEPIFDEKDYALILRDGEFVPGFIETAAGRTDERVRCRTCRCGLRGSLPDRLFRVPFHDRDCAPPAPYLVRTLLRYCRHNDYYRHSLLICGTLSKEKYWRLTNRCIGLRLT